MGKLIAENNRLKFTLKVSIGIFVLVYIATLVAIKLIYF